MKLLGKLVLGFIGVGVAAVVIKNHKERSAAYPAPTRKRPYGAVEGPSRDPNNAWVSPAQKKSLDDMGGEKSERGQAYLESIVRRQEDVKYGGRTRFEAHLQADFATLNVVMKCVLDLVGRLSQTVRYVESAVSPWTEERVPYGERNYNPYEVDSRLVQPGCVHNR